MKLHVFSIATVVISPICSALSIPAFTLTDILPERSRAPKYTFALPLNDDVSLAESIIQEDKLSEFCNALLTDPIARRNPYAVFLPHENAGQTSDSGTLRSDSDSMVSSDSVGDPLRIEEQDANGNIPTLALPSASMEYIRLFAEDHDTMQWAATSTDGFQTVQYILDRAEVPRELHEFTPDAIWKACSSFL